MESQISPLGSFARLPVELRRTIWEHIFYLEPHAPLKQEHLPILRTSRALHDEITSIDYDTVEIHITPAFWKGTTVYLQKKSHQLQPPTSYKNSKFAENPFDKVNMEIHLYAPDPTDPGQLLLLYRKAKKLVSGISCFTHSFRHVSICYQQHNRVDWHCDGTPNESIKYPGRRWLDREIVFIPFLKLKGVQSLEIIPANKRMQKAISNGFLHYSHDFIIRGGALKGNVSIYKDSPQYATIARMFNNTDSMMADTEFFLDTQLDYLPGYTSDMLRVSRWAEWFKDGTNGRSPYSDWFLYILRFHPECAGKHDHGLLKFINRFKIMVMTSTAFLRRGPKPYGDWDHRVFYKKFTHGYPPLSQSDLVRKGLLIAEWSMHVSLESLLPPFYWFYVAAMTWRFTHWKRYSMPLIGFRNLEILRHWCDYCRKVGFQFWCKSCEEISLEAYTMTCMQA